jgi:hypothetical protein
MFVIWSIENVFACKLDVDSHIENSTELWPSREAALENEVPKLEPNSVNTTHPVAGALVALTDDTWGRGADKLKLLERYWTPTVVVNAETLVLPQDLIPSEEIDTQTEDSAVLCPNRAEMEGSYAENPNPVKRSLIEPESGENAETFWCASWTRSNVRVLNVQARDNTLGGRDVTEIATETWPARPATVRQNIWDDDTHIVNWHADAPKTRVGLADPPNNAPTTDTISEPDDAPFAKMIPDSIADCTGRLKSDIEILLWILMVMRPDLEFNETALKTADESLTQCVASTDDICILKLGVEAWSPKATPLIDNDWEPDEADFGSEYDIKKSALNVMAVLRTLDTKELDEITTDPSRVFEPAMLLHSNDESECHFVGEQEDLLILAFWV